MVHEYYVGRLREKAEERLRRLAATNSRAGAQAYVDRIKDAVRRSFGPMPERTPLYARISGTDAYDAGFSIERIVYESRPGFLATGDLYVPDGISGKTAAVLGLCGHSPIGKAEVNYQAFCQGLARRGFIVFIIDPISQGERIQFFDADGDNLPSLCAGHNLIGNQQILVGDFFGSWCVWDAMRGLDYLLSRPEVDATRIGVTGNSGGGTQTAFLTALDPRISMAAPSCYIGSYLANLESELPADAEQNPPGIIAGGFDQADLLLCHAPRPTLVLSQIDDFFDERAARKAFEEVRRIHELLGSSDTVEYYAGPRDHGYHIENREAMYAFFLKHAGMTGSPSEAEFEPIPEERLYAVEGGNTAQAGSRRVFDFTGERAERLMDERSRVDEAGLIETSRRILSIPAADDTPAYRVLYHYRNRRADLNQRSQFAVATEPGIQVIVTVYGPESRGTRPPAGPLTAYIGHTGGESDIESIPELRTMTAGDRPLLAVDPRGFGHSVAQTCNSKGFFDAYGSDYLYAATGEMLGESYFGRRVFDVLRCIDFLIAKDAGEIELLGRGLGSTIAAFAALLHPSRLRVKLLDYLPSFHLLTQDPLACWPLSSLPCAVLQHFDLPDVHAALGSRIELERPWNARMEPMHR